MMNMESVWDYPRPPRLEKTERRIRVVQGGITLVDTCEAMRILETSHPPVYYVPPVPGLSRSNARGSFCEFKGLATYWDLGDAREVAWSYEQPATRYAGIAGYLAFYASRVEQCWVDEERVIPQEGDFYGGWITSEIAGPFKGGAGTRGW